MNTYCSQISSCVVFKYLSFVGKRCSNLELCYDLLCVEHTLYFAVFKTRVQTWQCGGDYMRLFWGLELHLAKR